MKGFFSSFRKAVIIILCALVVAAAVGICIVYVMGLEQKSILNRNEALEYALSDAGVSASDITITRQKLNQEGRKSYYEIDFYTDSYEYTYEIDATTGAVIGMDMKAFFDRPMAAADDGGRNAAGDAPLEDGMRENADSDNGQEDTSQSGSRQPDDGQGDLQQSGNGQGDSTQSGSQQSGSGQGDSQQSGNIQQGDQQPDNGQPDTQEISAGQEASQPQPSGEAGRIGVDAAKDKALADAGFKTSEVTFTKSKLDLDDGIYVYDIEFYTADAEYEYEINAATGTIVDKEMEMRQGSASSGTTGTSDRSGAVGASGNADSDIGTDRAKEIAAEDAKVALSDAVFTKSKLDLDDGIYVYEIEFYTADAEYEYEINAATGAIMDKSMEMRQSRASSGITGTSGGSGAAGASGNGGSYIGADRAKEIAAEDAGFEVSELFFTKVKLEKERDYSQYEIEFYVGNGEWEYEYCIDAFTGEILEFDYEHDGHGYSHAHHACHECHGCHGCYGY